MTILTKGFGSTSPNIVGHGFGPDPVTVVAVEEELRRPGRSSRRFEPLFQPPKFDVYKITAILSAVNNLKIDPPIKATVSTIVDENDEFTVRNSGQIRITKTKPKESIFIKVIKLFKRE